MSILSLKICHNLPQINGCTCQKEMSGISMIINGNDKARCVIKGK